MGLFGRKKDSPRYLDEFKGEFVNQKPERKTAFQKLKERYHENKAAREEYRRMYNEAYERERSKAMQNQARANARKKAREDAQRYGNKGISLGGFSFGAAGSSLGKSLGFPEQGQRKKKKGKPKSPGDILFG